MPCVILRCNFEAHAWCREYLNILDRSEEAVSSMFGNWSSTTSRSQKATLPTPTAPPAPKDAAAVYQVP